MGIEKSKAIVLKNQVFRETSYLVNFYTRDFGKINGIIKGVRGTTNKTNNNLEPFSISEIVFYKRKKGTLYTVSQCDLLKFYKNIRREYKKIVYAAYFVDLLSAVTTYEDKNEDLYDLAVSTLDILDQQKDPEAIKSIFEIKTLILSGFKPRIDACINCGREFLKEAKFSTRYGGLLCKNCFSEDRKAIDIYNGTLATMLHIEKANLDNVWRLNLTSEVKRQLNEILDNFIKYHIDTKIKSKFYADFLV
jgi:DNA repair protein RecO (recombination protein O)